MAADRLPMDIMTGLMPMRVRTIFILGLVFIRTRVILGKLKMGTIVMGKMMNCWMMNLWTKYRALPLLMTVCSTLNARDAEDLKRTYADGTDDINFEFVYALHNFVATVDGQANASKGDNMVLLDDSNSYWWLVRIVKDGSIGTDP